MKLYIKNMVSICCKKVVKAELKKLELYYVYVNLGEAEVLEELSDVQRAQLSTALQKFGLELMSDKKEILVERIKNAVVELVYSNEMRHKATFSNHIAKKLHRHYPYLSSLFSEVMGTTIEHFVIANRIERVKELLFYDEHNLTEISFMLNYSSVAHLSNQFKKVTGISPSIFKKLNQKRCHGLDELWVGNSIKSVAKNTIRQNRISI